MKLDAIKHQGVTSAQVGQKLLSVEKVAEDAGESRNQVKRYIRLTYLIPELLEMVDENKIAFNPAVEISYLEQSEQRVLLNAMELNDCTPSHAQSIRLKKLSQEACCKTGRSTTSSPNRSPTSRSSTNSSGKTFANTSPKATRTSRSAIRSSSCWSNGSAGGSGTGTAADSNFVRLQRDKSHRGKNGTGRVQWPCRCRTVLCKSKERSFTNWYQDIYRLKRDTTTPC